MTTRTKVMMMVASLLGVLAAGVGFVVWPNYAETKRLNSQIRDLYGRMNTFAQQAERVDRLARELRQLERRTDAELKLIPVSPDAELLIGKLSLPIDGRTIRDQTFTTGQAGPAVTKANIVAQALPITVEMQAQFESIFATLRLAETMDRLIRVTSVRIERDPQSRVQDEARSDAWFDEPWLMASIGLDAVFEPASSTGGASVSSTSQGDALLSRSSRERRAAVSEEGTTP